LAKSIKAGGAGKWGPVPMPAQAALSDADALILATWILAGAK
jgi:cytochrome c